MSQAFSGDLSRDVRAIGFALKRRGLAWYGGNETRELIFPAGGLSDGELEAFYQRCHGYAFRLFLREVIRRRHAFSAVDLAQYIDVEMARLYCSELARWRIIEPIAKEKWRLQSPAVRSFGETLEWYVAQVFRHAFGCPAAHGIRATNGPSGGDYDVISLVENRLVYVEVKSSPPKHIAIESIQSFLGRIEDLGPDLAIFLEDTHLRLEDKIVPMFAEAFLRRYGKAARQYGWPRQERRHLFSMGPSEPAADGSLGRSLLFIANSRPSIEANLTTCLRQLLARALLPMEGRSRPSPLVAGPESEDPTMLPEPPPSRWTAWPLCQDGSPSRTWMRQESGSTGPPEGFPS